MPDTLLFFVFPANKNGLNGQVVRTIGKTAVGSIDLMIKVDSKFEIVRSMEKILKEAVSANRTDEDEEWVEESKNNKEVDVQKVLENV